MVRVHRLVSPAVDNVSKHAASKSFVLVEPFSSLAFVGGLGVPQRIKLQRPCTCCQPHQRRHIEQKLAWNREKASREHHGGEVGLWFPRRANGDGEE